MACDEGCGDVTAELEAAIDAVLSSTSPKRLIIAGPGAGKTTLFRRLLDDLNVEDRKCLALTFINNLKDDLEQALAGLAQVRMVIEVEAIAVLGASENAVALTGPAQ